MRTIFLPLAAANNRIYTIMQIVSETKNILKPTFDKVTGIKDYGVTKVTGVKDYGAEKLSTLKVFGTEKVTESSVVRQTIMCIVHKHDAVHCVN